MIKRFLNLIVLLSVYTFTSCNLIMDDAACITLDGDARKVAFTLAVEDASLGTRAAWSEGYLEDIGTSYDSRITLNGLQVLFYDNSNRYVGKVENLMHMAVSQTEYQFSGDITGLPFVIGEKYKVMVLANCPEVKQDLGYLNFSIEDIAYPNGYLPMWGIGTMTVQNAEFQDIGTIDLLRAVSKVEVVLSDDMRTRGYTLDGASIRHYNTNGYCVPNGWDRVEATNQLDQENCMNAYHSHIDNSILFVEGIPQTSRWIYIPEFNVLHTAVNRPLISVTLGDGTLVPLSFNDAISFGNYNDGKIVPGTEYNIVRNNIYRFTISGINAGIEIEYEVLPWTDGGTWERGEFAYPTYHNPVMPEIPLNSETPVEITSLPVMAYNNSDPESDAFSVWFRMESPTGQNWLPVVDKATTDYNIVVYYNGAKVYDNIDEVMFPATNLVSSDGWYNIKVIPRDPENVGSVVEFGITYTQDWMPDGASTYLFINGMADEIAWPNSGNDPKIIKIEQI